MNMKLSTITYTLSFLILGRYGLHVLFKPRTYNPFLEQNGTSKEYCPSGSYTSTLWDEYFYPEKSEKNCSGHVLTWYETVHDKIKMCTALIRPDGKILSDIKIKEISDAPYNSYKAYVSHTDKGNFLIGKNVDGYLFDGPGKYPYIKY